jgi:type I restriction-modification system DNA methylase subunit
VGWEREPPFTARLWKKFDDYLSKYRVDGAELKANPPNSISYYNKLPDIVVTDKLGTPQLIVETKRKADDTYEELYDPLGRAPIAQALCYAALALEHHGLDRTPLFATANKAVIVIFKGVKREELSELVDVNVCLERHPTPEDWARALKPGAYTRLLQEYIVDRLETPLSDDTVKKLFGYVREWIKQIHITPAHLYRILVEQLRHHIEELHDENVEDAVKVGILKDQVYFEKLHHEALKRGYRSLLSPGIASLCPHEERSVIENVCKPLAEELSKIASKAGTPQELFHLLQNVANKTVNEIVSYCKRPGPPRICGKRVAEVISFRNLSRMMTYVLATKILAYKILEIHYRNIPSLKPLNVSDPNDINRILNELFSNASRVIEETSGIKDFRPLFETGLYDLIMFKGLDAVKKVNALIEIADTIKESLRQLPGVIGYVYEGFIPPAERHRLGQFYTPPAVARLITVWSIRSGDDLVLDGGCGSGTFLIEAYKRLLWLRYRKIYGQSYPLCRDRENEHQEVLNRLYGVDINTFATQLTSLHLMLMEPLCPFSKLNVKATDFFSLAKMSFDAVIGNPPYTRWVEIPDSTKELIRERVGDLARAYDLIADLRRGREPGIYVYWIMHAAKNLLKDCGRLGMIISNMWLQTDYGVDFGKFLLDNFKIKALIDVSYRLFEALISTVIILAEKEPDENARRNNEVLLVRIPPIDSRLSDREVERKLDETLKCIEDSITPNYDFSETQLRECRKEHGIWYKLIKQSEIPRDKKWISLFFEKVEDIVGMLETHPLMIRIGEWFKPSRGNSIYSIWALDNGRRPDLGAKDFFYFNVDKINQWDRDNKTRGFKEVVGRYLVPAITASRYVKTFMFTEEDWGKIRDMERREKGKVTHPGNAWMLVLHERRERLPQQLQEYIKWGETECRTKIKATRGGGRVCSKAEACRAREEVGEPYFYGWYDLGGYIPTPIMAIYQPRYHPQFFLATMFNLITYPAIITLIPRVEIKIGNTIYDPIEYNKIYGNIIDNVKPDIELDEVEVKALLAYLNSTFNWVWLEQNARYIAKGPLGLEVNTIDKMPIPNVKKVDRRYVEELAKLFDKLESAARAIIGTSASSSMEGEEEEGEGGEKLRMFKELRPIFREIDGRIAEILGIHVDVDELWRHAWEMMERRIKGAGREVRPGAVVEVEVIAKRKSRRKTERKTKKRRGSSSHGSSMPLTKWFKS